MYYFQEKIVLMNFLLVLQILNHNTIGFHKSSICIKVSGAQSMADFRGLVLRTQPYVVSANNADSMVLPYQHWHSKSRCFLIFLFNLKDLSDF